MDGTTQNEPAPAQEPDASKGEAIPAVPGRGTVQVTGAGGVGSTIDILQIMSAIPHRYPFLMIDRMVEVVPGESAVGIKNVTVNEPFFQGHFPSKPVMPGVLIIEAMAQTAAALVVLTLGGDFEGKLVYFMTIENAKFRRPVGPGDQLRIHVVKERQRGNVYKFRGVARVDGVSVAEASYGAMIMG
jgi:3-hydroxyacyl-[acyl-carrier-protein] dehydratase